MFRVFKFTMIGQSTATRQDVGCSSVTTDYISTSHYTDTEVSRWLPAHLSSTKTELDAILEALHIVAYIQKDVYFFLTTKLPCMHFDLPHL